MDKEKIKEALDTRLDVIFEKFENRLIRRKALENAVRYYKADEEEGIEKIAELFDVEADLLAQKIDEAKKLPFNGYQLLKKEYLIGYEEALRDKKNGELDEDGADEAAVAQILKYEKDFKFISIAIGYFDGANGIKKRV
jgi:hypothetical protein